MGASPHLRGRERSSRKEAAAARDGRGSPSHQHTVPGRQLSFLLSAGGRVAVTSKPFRGRGGGCRPPPPILSWKAVAHGIKSLLLYALFRIWKPLQRQFPCCEYSA